MSDEPTPFSDPDFIAGYADSSARLVPGLADLRRMATLLLAERTPADGRVLVLGAGGGLELKAFAEAHPGWQFDGIDPSAEMLDLARVTLGPLRSRVHLRRGYVNAAPEGPFDAAACLLTLHFVPVEERVPTMQEVHRRLKPGAPFVMAHLSFPQDEPARALWLARYAAFAVASGVGPAAAERGRAAIGAQLPILAPEKESALLRDAGFSDAGLFYAGLAFRGWVAYA